MKHIRPDGTVGEVDIVYTVMPGSGPEGISVMHSMFDRETGERVGCVETITQKPLP